MEFLRSLLVLGIKMIDEGKCNHLSPEELSSLTATVSDIVIQPESMGLIEACKYLRISRTKFFDLRTIGVITKPKKRRGFREKEYYKVDLDKTKQYIANEQTY